MPLASSFLSCSPFFSLFLSFSAFSSKRSKKDETEEPARKREREKVDGAKGSKARRPNPLSEEREGAAKSENKRLKEKKVDGGAFLGKSFFIIFFPRFFLVETPVTTSVWIAAI